jgi:hypothetical protein
LLKVLYFSYDGLLDPLGVSQIVPYVSALVSAGHSLTIVSYEKVERTKEQVKFMEIKLQKIGVHWVRLQFKPGKLWAIKRLIIGALLIRKLCRDLEPDFLHLRGFFPAIIFQFSFIKIPFLYDFRGFALGEWVDIGKINSSSLLYFVLNKMDKRAVKNASGLVVLEECAKKLLKYTYEVPNVPLKVIRTCTDVKRYKTRKNQCYKKSGALRFVFLGGARFPYRPDLALMLIGKLIEHGFDCYIDFINKGDHAIIKKAKQLTNISEKKVQILSCEHCEIPDIIGTYDCGIVMVETSYWRRVCSPTKVGEYLAGGLPVISLKGIDAIDELAERTECVVTVSSKELEGCFEGDTAKKISSFIKTTDIFQKCKTLAKNEYNLEMASNLYVELYTEMEARILK